MPPQYSNNVSEQFLSEKVSVGLPWRILIFSAVLFAGALFIYFGLLLGYEPYLDSQARTLDNNISELGRSVNVEDQERFVNFYSQLVNLKTVLEDHPFVSNIYTFLEKNTIATVYYREAQLNAGERSLRLEGLSKNIQNLAEQVAVFEGAAQVESVLTDEVSVSPDGAVFTISLVFKKEFFSRPL